MDNILFLPVGPRSVFLGEQQPQGAANKNSRTVNMVGLLPSERGEALGARKTRKMEPVGSFLTLAGQGIFFDGDESRSDPDIPEYLNLEPLCQKDIQNLLAALKFHSEANNHEPIDEHAWKIKKKNFREKLAKALKHLNKLKQKQRPTEEQESLILRLAADELTSCSTVKDDHYLFALVRHICRMLVRLSRDYPFIALFENLTGYLHSSGNVNCHWIEDCEFATYLYKYLEMPTLATRLSGMGRYEFLPYFDPEQSFEVCFPVFENLSGPSKEVFLKTLQESTNDIKLTRWLVKVLTNESFEFSKLRDVLRKVKPELSYYTEEQMTIYTMLMLSYHYRLMKQGNMKKAEALLAYYELPSSGRTWIYPWGTFLLPMFKQYGQALCLEKQGRLQEAETIYNDLAQKDQMPVFRQLLRIHKCLNDRGKLEATCARAIAYYQEKGFPEKVAEYERELVSMDFARCQEQADGDDNPLLAEINSQSSEKGVVARKVRKRKKKNRGGALKRKPHEAEVIDIEQGKVPALSAGEKPEVSDIKTPATEVGTVVKAKVPLTASRTINRSGASDDVQKLWIDSEATRLDEFGYYKKISAMVDDYRFPKKDPAMVAGIDQIVQEALSHYPDDLWILHEAGWWYYISGRYQQSMKQLQKGIVQVAMGSDRFKAYSAGADCPPSFQVVIDWLLEEGPLPGSSEARHFSAFLSIYGHCLSRSSARSKLKSACDFRQLADRLDPRRVYKAQASKSAADSKLTVLSEENFYKARTYALTAYPKV